MLLLFEKLTGALDLDLYPDLDPWILVFYPSVLICVFKLSYVTFRNF